MHGIFEDKKLLLIMYLTRRGAFLCVYYIPGDKKMNLPSQSVGREGHYCHGAPQE